MSERKASSSQDRERNGRCKRTAKPRKEKKRRGERPSERGRERVTPGGRERGGRERMAPGEGRGREGESGEAPALDGCRGKGLSGHHKRTPG